MPTFSNAFVLPRPWLRGSVEHPTSTAIETLVARKITLINLENH